MARKLPKNPADYIQPLNINGMDGRMLYLPARGGKETEMLFLYGHHSSIERWWGLTKVMNRYGAVTMPDFPGFGGMDSFYKIGKKPTIDNMADYLAAFVKMRYKRKKVVIVGMSFGFVVATRMLQRYPELTNKVTMIVSLVGFAHRDDFIFTKPRYLTYLLAARLLSFRLSSFIVRNIVLQPVVLRNIYARTHNAKHKFAQADSKEEFNRLMDVEVGLWHDNDLRTWGFTSKEILKLDNCKVRINLPVWHISVRADHFFNNNFVEQHMRVIFTDFTTDQIIMTTHAPSVIADEKDAAPFVPAKLRRVLAKLP
jgi:pimeloyl-ACP methyl ester carboxylesterase